ncbi:lipid A biosynthesis (KDO)2-(lauroyl)-lipid IVA acyltransferase [Shigella sonnei]|nr:lipid A biosynthesis (KDO)2-(lauroyl)-lipid IVA acyltransferase [Shigella sonnei]
MNISQAMIIPLFPVYDEKKHFLTIEVRPPMDACIASADNKMIARQMNKTVEILVGSHPEQYIVVSYRLPIETHPPSVCCPFGTEDCVDAVR